MNDWIQWLGNLLGVGGGGTVDPTQQQLQTLAKSGFNFPGAIQMASQTPFGAPLPRASNANNWITQLLNLVFAGGGAHYGSQELDTIRQIYNMQRAAAAQAMNIHPGQLGTLATQMAAPLNKQLAYQVGNAADQNSAMRGMAQAPGAVAAGEAGALAPFEQQNQNIGAQLASNANQLALERVNPSFSVGEPDYLSILTQLQKLGQGSTFALPGTP